MNVLVLSMTTWGEMGNWLSGRTLTRALAGQRPGWTVTQQPVDRLLPALAEVGARIRSVTMNGATPAERFTGYARTLEGLLDQYPVGMETGAPVSAAVRRQLDELRTAIEAHAPDLIIGTKGLICRLALAATGNRIPVVNYVTNHGHFQFAVHRCPGAVVHLARTDAAGRFLRAECGCPSDRVAVVGYLIAIPRIDATEAVRPAAPTPSGLHVVVVSNRGGREYVEVLRRLLAHERRPAGTFLALNDPVLCGEARALVDAHGQHERWQIFEKLEQEDFVRMLAARGHAGSLALVTKASPNSIMEAVFLGIPMFLFRSGLPMEDWSCDLVTAGGFGAVAETSGELCAEIDAALGAPERLETFAANERAYAKRELDQKSVLARILTALDAVASRATVPGLAVRVS